MTARPTTSTGGRPTTSAGGQSEFSGFSNGFEGHGDYPYDANGQFVVGHKYSPQYPNHYEGEYMDDDEDEEEDVSEDEDVFAFGVPEVEAQPSMATSTALANMAVYPSPVSDAPYQHPPSATQQTVSSPPSSQPLSSAEESGYRMERLNLGPTTPSTHHLSSKEEEASIFPTPSTSPSSLSAAPSIKLSFSSYLSTASVEEDSPFPEVRASVSNIDDPEMPAMTFRMWIVGLSLCMLSAALNVFFNFRSPAPSVVPNVLLLLGYPMGKGLSFLLPIRTYRIPLPRWPAWMKKKTADSSSMDFPSPPPSFTFSLNPGPWNIKEHGLVFIMGNVAISSPYAINAIVVSEIYYNQIWGYWFSLVLVLATQLTGFGLAGLCRRFLVWPASMVWPQNLVACTLLNTLHAEEEGEDLEDDEESRRWEATQSGQRGVDVGGLPSSSAVLEPHKPIKRRKFASAAPITFLSKFSTSLNPFAPQAPTSSSDITNLNNLSTLPTLPTLSNLTALSSTQKRRSRRPITRYRFFLYITLFNFIFFFLPGFLFTALSIFSFICWAVPENVVVNQLFGVYSGMGMSVVTADWTQVNPLVEVGMMN